MQHHEIGNQQSYVGTEGQKINQSDCHVTSLTFPSLRVKTFSLLERYILKRYEYGSHLFDILVLSIVKKEKLDIINKELVKKIGKIFVEIQTNFGALYIVVMDIRILSFFLSRWGIFGLHIVSSNSIHYYQNTSIVKWKYYYIILV